MKKPLIGILVLLLLLIGAVLVAPSFIEWNRYKEDIAHHVGAATGRTLTIAGGIDLALLPRPMLRVQGVRLASLPGAGEPDFAQLGELHVEVAPIPLLGGRIQVESITLIEPTIVLEVLEDGRRTWDFGAGDRRPGPDLLDSVRLDQVRIENGTVVYRNALTGEVERFENVDANVVAGSLVGPFQVQTTFTSRGVPLAAELSAGRIGEGGAMPLRATVRLPDTEAALRFAGIVVTGPVLKAQGDVRAEGPDLRPALAALLTALGEVPANEMPKLFAQPFNLRTAINASAQQVELNAIEAQVGETRGTGALKMISADPGGGPDHMDLTLTVNRLDLDGWLALTQHGDKPDAPPEAAGFRLPQDLRGRFAVGVEALSWNGGVARQGRIEGELTDGMLVLSRAAALLPGGSDVAVAGTVAAEEGNPVLGLQIEANADNLRALLGWLGVDVSRVPADRLRKVSLRGYLDGRPDDLRLSGLDLRLDTSVVTGGIAYADREGRPAFGARLDIDRLNLDGYLPMSPEGGIGVDLPGLLTGFDATVEAKLGSLTAGGLPINDLTLDATLSNGGLVLRRFQAADLAGARLDAEGAVAAIQPLDGLDLTFSLNAGTVAPLNRHFGVPMPLPPEQLGPVEARGRIAGNPERLEMELALAAIEGRVEAGGVVTQPLASPTFDLKIRGTWPKGEDLARVLWPDWRPKDLGTLDLYAEVAGSEGAVALSGIQGLIGAMPVTGEATVDLVGPTPVVDATLSTGELVLDRFQAAPPMGSSRKSEMPIDADWLGALEGRLGLTAKALVIDGQRIEDTALDLRLEPEAAILEKLDGGYRGGRLGLEGRLSRGPDGTPALAAKATLVGAKLAEGFVDGQGNVQLDAVPDAMDLELEASATGTSRSELLATLDGGGRIALRDGTLSGVDFGRIAGKLDDLASARDPSRAVETLLGQALSRGTTPFRSLQAGLRIEDGVLTAEELALDAETATAKGGGRIDLRAGTLELGVDVAPADSGDLPPFRLILSGPLEKPKRTAEAKALIEALRARAAPARDKPAEPAPENAPPEGEEPAEPSPDTKAPDVPAPDRTASGRPDAAPAGTEAAPTVPAPTPEGSTAVIDDILTRLKR